MIRIGPERRKKIEELTQAFEEKYGIWPDQQFMEKILVATLYKKDITLDSTYLASTLSAFDKSFAEKHNITPLENPLVTKVDNEWIIVNKVIETPVIEKPKAKTVIIEKPKCSGNCSCDKQTTDNSVRTEAITLTNIFNKRREELMKAAADPNLLLSPRERDKILFSGLALGEVVKCLDVYLKS